MLQTTQQTSALPRTLEEFANWEPTDGFKYEWNDGELIKFVGLKQQQWYVYKTLQNLFFEQGYIKLGTLMAEPDVMLTGIQMRRPDIAYFTREQIKKGRENENVVPEFVIEVISGSDNFYKVEEKITEYFKAGVKVVWNIVPDEKIVQVYTSRRDVKICIENDICSAAPVLPEFEISVAAIFAD